MQDRRSVVAECVPGAQLLGHRDAPVVHALGVLGVGVRRYVGSPPESHQRAAAMFCTQRSVGIVRR